MFYFVTITAATLLISLFHFLLDGGCGIAAFGMQLLLTTLGVAAVIAIDGLFAFVIRRMPERYFAPESRLFSVGKGEINFYRRTCINVWKKHVPEWGCFTGCHKDRLRSSDDSAYLGRFLLESNYGVAGHLAGAIFGYLILLLPFLSPLSVALPIAVINMILSLLPTAILRYNTPALQRLYRRNLERERAKDMAQSQTVHQ